MTAEEIVKNWFRTWENGDFENIPITENFEHTSPYGTISGKQAYFEVIEANKDKFLGNQFIIRDEIYQGNKACIRYQVSKGDFSMEVTEWLYIREGLIEKIIAYYNIEGEISENRKLAGDF